MVAIGVGALSLVIVLSVFNGFEDLVKGLYNDFYADIRVVPASGKRMIMRNTKLDSIRAIPGIYGVSCVVEEKAVLNGAFQAIVTVKGVDSSYTKVTRINSPAHLLRGAFSLGTVDNPSIVVGAGIENAAGVEVEKYQYPAVLYLPNKQAAKLASEDGLNAYSVKPAGTFAVQQEFDNKYIFTNLPFLQFMLGMQADEYSGLEIKVRDDAGTVQQALQKLLGKEYQVETRYQQNMGLYRVMKTEKWFIYIILSLILVVASFNIIGSLTMLVLEKQKDIAILKAMGAGDVRIRRIFLLEGLILGVIGGGTGMLLAVIICMAQIHFKLLKLGGSTFIIDYYPVAIRWNDLVLVGATILAITLIAAWIPAYRAGKRSFSLKSTG